MYGILRHNEALPWENYSIKERIMFTRQSPWTSHFQWISWADYWCDFSFLTAHDIYTIQIPANCTDELQPLDIAIN